MANVGYATLTVIPSAKGFGSAMAGQTNPQMAAAGAAGGKKFGGGMVSSAKSFAGPLAGIFAVGAGVAFFKGAVNGASDLAESASKVKVVFGEQSAAILKTSETAATSMGLSKSAYLEAAGGLGNLLVSLKIAPKAAAGMSQQMVKLAGDMASFNNVSPEEALAAIQSGLTGETEPLKRFGVNMNDATLKAQAMKMGLIKTTKDALTPQQKALAAQALIMAQTGTAQGDFARTSTGLANQQRIAAAQTEDLKNRIGKGLLPIVTSITKGYAGFVKGINNGTGAGGAFRDALTSVGGAIKTAIGTIRSIIGFLRQHSTTVKIVAAVITTLLLPAIIRWGVQSTISAAKSVAAWVASKASAVSSIAFQVTGSTLIALGWLRVGIAATVNAAKIVAAWLISKLGAAGTLAMYAVTFAVIVAGWIATGISAMAGAVVMAAAWLLSIWPIALVVAAVIAVAIIIVKNWDKIKSFVTGAVKAVVNFVKKNWPLLLAIITGPIGLIVLFVVKNWDRIKSLTSSLVSSVVGFFKKLGSGIRDKISDAVSYAKGMPGKIKSAIGNLGSLLLGAGKDLINGLINGIKSKFGDVKNTLGDLTGKLTSWKGPESLDRVILKSSGALVIDGFITGLESRYGNAQSSLGDLTNSLAGEVRVPTAPSPTTGVREGASPGGGSLDGLSAEAIRAAFAGMSMEVELTGGSRAKAKFVQEGLNAGARL